MPIKQAFVYSVFINLFFVVLCLAFGDIKYGAIDDYFMAAILSGAHGTDYNPHLFFVNAIYGYALLPLYQLFPKVGWYYIGEIFGVFLSFVAVGYVLLRRCGLYWGGLIAALFTTLYASDFYQVVQFTQCASILSASGMLMFVHGLGFSGDEYRERWNWPIILGVLLLLWGSIMRWQAFLMGMPFFAIGLLFVIKRCWRNRLIVLVSISFLFVISFAFHTFDRSLYQDPAYASFVKIQGPRAALGDGSNYDKNAVYEDLEEMGKSGKDYHLLSTWVFYDTETFTADSMQSFVEVTKSYKFKNELGNLPHLLLVSIGGSLQSPLFWTWFVFCLIIFKTNRKKAIYLWASLAVICFLMSVLLEQNRLVYRVESGFWLYASVLAIPLWGRFKVKLPRVVMGATLVIIALANVYEYASSGDMVRDPSTGDKRKITIEDSTDYKQVFDYIDSNPDKLFLLSMNAYMRFSHHKNPPYLAEPIGSYRRTISLGYWTPYLPEITQALEDFGVTNPIKDVVHDNVVVINEGLLADFLERHYYDSVAVDTLKAIGEMVFYKYRLVDGINMNPNTISP